MNAGDTSLHISIGNPKSNTCGLYATLRLSDGTVLYKSDLLEPGSGLTDVPLSKSLEKGEYQAMVLYECVTLDDSHQNSIRRNRSSHSKLSKIPINSVKIQKEVFI